MNTTIIIILIIAFGFIGMGLLLIKLQRVTNENVIIHKALLEKQELLDNKNLPLNSSDEVINAAQKRECILQLDKESLNVDLKNALDKFNICETDLKNVKAKLIVSEELVETKQKALMNLRRDYTLLTEQIKFCFGIRSDVEKDSYNKVIQLWNKIADYTMDPDNISHPILVKKIKNSAEYNVLSYRFNIKTKILDLGVLPSNIKEGTIKYLPIDTITYV